MTAALPPDAIRTTLVGSYPVPRWVYTAPGKATLRDALQVVLKTQELAGLDVLVDGELSRFDFDHPETNGMIEYFLQPMAGVRTALSQAETRAFQEQAGMQFRTRPAGIVTGPLDQGYLNLAADYAELRRLTLRPVKFTVTSPYMLAKTVYDAHYRSLPALTMALAEVLAQSEPEYHGRLTALTFLPFGVSTLAGLLFGNLADAGGERVVLIGMGLAVVAIAALAGLRYDRLGGPPARARQAARAVLDKMQTYIAEAGRQPSEVGQAGRLRMPGKSPDEWLAEAEGWRDLGGSHIMAEARRGPLSAVDEHIDAMRRFREVIPVGWGQ